MAAASAPKVPQNLPGRLDKKVVIDTNVILFDALAINKFHDSDIYIPFSVIEEIDRFKRDLGENGRNARHFSRFVDVLREKGSLAQGVELETAKSFVFVVS
ncbi:MAG: PIN domain-containing protein, partial [Bdellovibrionales bacterium]